MKRLCTWAVCLAVAGAMLGFTGQQDAETVVEFSKPVPPSEGLGTKDYECTEAEAPFRAQVNERAPDHWAGLQKPPPQGQALDPAAEAAKQERKAQKLAEAQAYELRDQVGRYVAWFAIVRGVSVDNAAGQIRLELQNCNFDGLTDLDIQVVSIFGAGDFRATVRGTKANIPPLALVCVYGKVGVDKDGLAEVSADYVRVWDWGLFTFMDYGVDKTNPKWVALRKVARSKVYRHTPTTEYYESILGKREPTTQPASPEGK